MIALGGNALGYTPQEQLKNVKTTSIPIADIIEQGHELIIAHGNGPQIGMINLTMETASHYNPDIPKMPFAECVAMTQGYIGYHLQNAIREELLNRGIKKPVVTVITQVVVNKEDPDFSNPSKPIGKFFSEEEARQLSMGKDCIMKEDSGRGWRKVVPSPVPLDVVEKESIQLLVEAGNVVITVGGGGIPVVADENALRGVSAVIDKDLASERMAEILQCDYLIILTAVEQVAINYGKPNQKGISKMTFHEAQNYINQNQFAKGSMLPKVQAAVSFAKSREGRKSIIAALDKAGEALMGNMGTLIY